MMNTMEVPSNTLSRETPLYWFSLREKLGYTNTSRYAQLAIIYLTSKFLFTLTVWQVPLIRFL